MTASKLILDRAGHEFDNMGLTSFKGIFPTKADARLRFEWVSGMIAAQDKNFFLRVAPNKKGPTKMRSLFKLRHHL